MVLSSHSEFAISRNYLPPGFSHPCKCDSDLFGAVARRPGQLWQGVAVTVLRSSQKRGTKNETHYDNQKKQNAK